MTRRGEWVWDCRGEGLSQPDFWLFTGPCSIQEGLTSGAGLIFHQKMCPIIQREWYLSEYINIPWWMYSRVQHTLFCHLCHCELIPRSLSDSISKIILCPLTILTFKSFHLHDFPSYLCSSLSLSVCVFYLFISFSSQLLSLLRFARAAVTRASFLSFPGFPLHIYLAFFLHLSPQFLTVTSLLSQSFSVLY